MVMEDGGGKGPGAGPSHVDALDELRARVLAAADELVVEMTVHGPFPSAFPRLWELRHKYVDARAQLGKVARARGVEL